MYSKSIKNEAIKLRKEGNSYSFISSKISVAKSTLSNWLENVPFLPNELVKHNRIENINNFIRVKRADKVSSYISAFKYSSKEIGKLDKRDIFMLGLGIYIGEGSKTSNQIRIVNSDPRIINFTIKWFKLCFELSDSNFRVRIHTYPDNDEKRTIDFWVNSLNVKREYFQPTHIDNRVDKKKNREGVLPYGTAHLSIVGNGNKEYGVLLQRKIIASIDFALNQTLRD
jgi:hypothetical protein